MGNSWIIEVVEFNFVLRMMKEAVNYEVITKSSLDNGPWEVGDMTQGS